MPRHAYVVELKQNLHKISSKYAKKVGSQLFEGKNIK